MNEIKIWLRAFWMVISRPFPQTYVDLSKVLQNKLKGSIIWSAIAGIVTLFIIAMIGTIPHSF